MKPLWIIQTNLGEASDIHCWLKAADEAGCFVAEVEHVPFSDELPDISYEGPVVLYGTVSFIKAAQADGRWQPGVFASPELFSYENWAKNYGALLLNSPDATLLCTIGDFALDTRPYDEDIFVRPQHDTKSVDGRVWVAGKFREWCIAVSGGGYAGVDASTPIVVGKPFGITSEWRLFIVNGEIVGASRYRHQGRLAKQAGAPQSILDFARSAIAKWDPAPAYVLDVCLSGGNPYIVEAQGFNSAGHYAADLTAIVNAASQEATRLWNGLKVKTQ